MTLCEALPCGCPPAPMLHPRNSCISLVVCKLSGVKVTTYGISCCLEWVWSGSGHSNLVVTPNWSMQASSWEPTNLLFDRKDASSMGQRQGQKEEGEEIISTLGWLFPSRCLWVIDSLIENLCSKNPIFRQTHRLPIYNPLKGPCRVKPQF